MYFYSFMTNFKSDLSLFWSVSTRKVIKILIINLLFIAVEVVGAGQQYFGTYKHASPINYFFRVRMTHSQQTNTAQRKRKLSLVFQHLFIKRKFSNIFSCLTFQFLKWKDSCRRVSDHLYCFFCIMRRFFEVKGTHGRRVLIQSQLSLIYHSLRAELKQISANLDNYLNFSQLWPRKYSLYAQQHYPLRSLSLGSWQFKLNISWKIASISYSLIHLAAIPNPMPNFNISNLSLALGSASSILSLSSLGMSCLTRWQMGKWWGVVYCDSLMDSSAETMTQTYSLRSALPLLSSSSRTKLKYLMASGNISSCLQTSPIFFTSPPSLSSPSSRQVRKALEKWWKALLHRPRSSSQSPRLLSRWARLQGVSMPSYSKERQLRARSRQSCFFSLRQRLMQALAMRLRSLERSSVRFATFFLISSLRADSRNRWMACLASSTTCWYSFPRQAMRISQRSVEKKQRSSSEEEMEQVSRRESSNQNWSSWRSKGMWDQVARSGQMVRA